MAVIELIGASIRLLSIVQCGFAGSAKLGREAILNGYFSKTTAVVERA